MIELKNFREEHKASKWLMARLTGVSESAYERFEKMDESQIPPKSLQNIKSLIENEDFMKEYQHNANDFVERTDFNELFTKAGQSPESIADTIGVSIQTIEMILSSKKFPSDAIRDLFVDYAMWQDNMMNNNVNQNSEPLLDEEQIEYVSPADENEGASTMSDDAPDNTLPNNEEFIGTCGAGVKSKDDEIIALTQQIEWYEDIISCFIKLSNLANNK